MADADYKYRLLGQTSDEYRKRPLLLQVDTTLMNLFAILEVRRDVPKRWSNMNNVRQIRIYSFLFGLAVMFLIMASYVLTGVKRGLMLTPSPYQFGGMGSPGPLVVTVGNASLLRDYEQMKLVVKSIQDKVEFSSKRRKPKLKELMNTEPHLFSVVPRRYLPGLKNPCWYEEYHGNLSSDPYQNNFYGRYSRRFRVVFQQLRGSFREHLLNREGRWFRLRCLPYFYIIGQPKCGTTDLYDRLRLHPEVKFTTFKEPHWWTRKRFGLIRLSVHHDRFPVEDYLDLFDQAAHQIQGNSTRDPTAASQPHLIIGEASASTMWDNNAWLYVYENATEGEPPFLVQDFVHALQPQARAIVMLRDPVERLYSDYLYFGISNKSAEDFHDKVSESLLLFQSCVSDSSLHSCVYNTTVNQAMPVRLHIGLYIVFLMDWLSVFSPEQILVLRLEDHASNTKFTMGQVFSFLRLGPLSKDLESDITRNPASNTRRPADRSLGPMLPVTKDLLGHFYRPFNQKLAKVLRNDSFLWDSS